MVDRHQLLLFKRQCEIHPMPMDIEQATELVLSYLRKAGYAFAQIERVERAPGRLVIVVNVGIGKILSRKSL